MPVRLLLFLLALSLSLWAQDPNKPAPASPKTSAPEEEPEISDNSFLVEEAYNQEYGVVQHAQTFSRFFDSKDFEYTFTQEWPFDPDPRHQFSYTIAGLNPGDPSSGFGIGDIALNYRYQV